MTLTWSLCWMPCETGFGKLSADIAIKSLRAIRAWEAYLHAFLVFVHRCPGRTPCPMLSLCMAALAFSMMTLSSSPPESMYCDLRKHGQRVGATTPASNGASEALWTEARS